MQMVDFCPIVYPKFYSCFNFSLLQNSLQLFFNLLGVCAVYIFIWYP